MSDHSPSNWYHETVYRVLETVSTKELLDELEKRKGVVAQFAKAGKLSRKKSEDYCGTSLTNDDYFPFGLASYAQMIHTKALRLVSLAMQSFPDISAPVNFESAYDTAIDLINYAGFLADKLERTQEEGNE